MPFHIEKIWDTIYGFLSGNALPALLILVVGILVVRILLGIVSKALNRSKLEKAAFTLIKAVLRVVLYGLLMLIIASKLGIDVTGIVALASVLTLAISLSVQNALTNLISGFTLLYTKPFSSGDFVEIAGQSGTVLEIGMTYTKLTTPDNKLVQIPNSSVVSSEIVNYSCTGKRRVAIDVAASYDAPVDKVIEALKEAASVEGILEDPAVFAAVTGYGDHAINYVVRVWCPTDSYWDVHNATLYNIKKVFDREGIAMTYPHLNVHLEK
jgi:small conductance mechanosensitive channel